MAEILQKMTDAVSKIVDRALGASLLDVVIQIGATLVLVLVVKFFFWGKITDFIQKRHELMEEEMTSAKNANEKALALQEKTDQEYQDIREKSKDIIDSARKRVEEERDIILEKAKAEAKDLMEQAQMEIELEKKKAESDIRKEAVNLATLMASKIIEKEINESDYQNLTVERIESSEKV
ncbi:MAG: F0F1 ATP synthase subunit B [Bacilli bacterium]|nr:F0F1 ATP synthase subunit B [Bacilli bacterium]MBN2876654.1 F0F1 ATP synthase subunit B [Bacilli bacterium]